MEVIIQLKEELENSKQNNQMEGIIKLKEDLEDTKQNDQIHALWYIRVWHIRVSTGFLKKIRVYQYPILYICKGNF